ncbi:MAG: hypothetical protein U1E29_16625 [Coriobacteriia bacterium]|nr:hypothetical protein [Coriobacteriia bacterium]
MFEDARFDKYEPEYLPINEDMYLVAMKYAAEFESMHLAMFEGGSFQPVGYVSYIAVRAVQEHTLELSWYPNIHDRFHELTILLPRDKIFESVGCWKWDWDPTIFVDNDWLDRLYAKTFSAFGLTDVIGMKNAIKSGQLSRDKLLLLKDKIDHLALQYPAIAFISFADSVLFKSNWTIGSVGNDLKYTYRPELFLEVAAGLRDTFRSTMGLDAYTVLTQGYNEYYDDGLLHVSGSRNHVCLNTLGTPFAELFAIDEAARQSIRNASHPPAEVYIADTLYHSLNLRLEFNKTARPKSTYSLPMSERPCLYFYSDLATLVDAIKPQRTD